MPREFVEQHGLEVTKGKQACVTLADGSKVYTSDYVWCYVDFKVVGSCLKFTVLPQCPLILGMPFLKQFNPDIDWQKQTVKLKEDELPHVSSNCFGVLLDGGTGSCGMSLGETHVLPTVPTNNCNNHSVVRAVPTCGVAGEQSGCSEVDTASPDKSGQTGGPRVKKNAATNSRRRSRKTKRSTKVLNAVQCTDSDQVALRTGADLLEMCDLKPFARGIAKGQYEEVFLCQLKCVEQTDEQQGLYFTHRTAHGTHGEGDKHSNVNLASQVLGQLKKAYPTVFEKPSFPSYRKDPDFYHYIDLKDSKQDPPKKKLYPLDQKELEALKSQLQELLDSGRIQHSHSPYGAPILFARKKDSEKLRMCIDYRALNKNTIADRYPLPRIDELFQRLNGSVIFSKFDLADGYHQIPMFKGDRYKTAFCTRYGQFEFLVMPFGLCNAPSTFQRIMNKILFQLLDKCALVYLDDILVYSRSVEQHIKDLDSVVQILAEHGLHLKESKCALFLESVEFLGHTISSKGVSVEQGKVQAVSDWPVPKCVNEIQQFLGLCNYYRRFIKGFASYARPLTDLTRKGIVFQWGPDCQRSFEQLKGFLTSAPCLNLFANDKRTRVVCDASQFAIGAVLEQLHDDDQWHPVEFFSKRLNSAQCNYSATEREMLAVIMALERWRQYLVGTEFVVYTDHASLVYLLEQSKLSRRQARWLDFLGQFKFEFQHISGKANVVADSLSRMPFPDDQQALKVANVVSLSDESFLLDVVKRCQDKAVSDSWFQSTRKLCAPDSQVYSERNGVVCRLINDYYAPVIPPTDEDLKRLILLELHASNLGGHLSAGKMYAQCKQRFYWPRMRKDIDKFCRECHVCQQNRTSTQKPYGLLQPNLVPSRPFQVVSMDFITQLPATTSGHDCLFVVVDRFSKYVILLPCKTAVTAPEVADMFFEHVVCKFGVPEKIICDRDTRFTSIFWKSLFKAFGCKLNLSTAFHPQTDGQTERFNRSLEQIVRCYIDPSQDNWDTLTSQVAFSLNSTVHAGTNVTPFKCIFGFEPALPLDVALSSLHDNKVQSVSDFVNSRVQVQHRVKQQLERYNSAMKRQADRKRRDLTLTIGDLVYLNTRNLALPTGLSKKFAAKFIGPYPVVKCLSDVVYELDLPSELGKLHNVFHVSLLKPHFGPIPPKRAPVFSVEENEFEVEQILGKRLTRNSVEYLVSWKGYNVWDATWEPMANLSNCMDLVNAFERSGLATRRSRRS